MKLLFERAFAAPPEVVWPYLTVPARMNAWSEATIEPIAPGEGGRDDAPGARRRVVVRSFGFRAALDEEVLLAEPPTRFVYRVTGGGMLRDHRGTILLRADPDGALLAWEVEFSSALPGLAPVLGALLKPKLNRSLDALVRLVGSGT